MAITDNIKAVLFDFDDTLQSRENAYVGYCNLFLDKYFPDITDSERAKKRADMEKYVEGGYRQRDSYFTELISVWNWENAPELDELCRHYNSNFGKFVSLFPDSVEVIKTLRRNGYLLGIVSNGPSELQNMKMDTAGIRDLFDIVIVSGDYGVHKPNRALFDIAAEKIGVKNEECLFVGDHPVNDIKGALGADMKAVWMNYGCFKNQCKENVPEIKKISELLDLFPNLK